MPELYPDNPTLLALDRHPDLGFDFIPTGLSPYFLEFRRLVNRLADAARLANDLRPHATGPLTLGVYPGRAHVNGQTVASTGTASLALAPSATTSVWIDTAGAVQSATTGFPTDPATHLPLAEAQTDAQAVTQLTDLRGTAAYRTPSATLSGLTATVAELNQALAGINPTVSNDALNFLTAGPTTSADSLHRHTQTTFDQASTGAHSLVNAAANPAANVALDFDVPQHFATPLRLTTDPSSGGLVQQTTSQTLQLLGAATMTGGFAGTVQASLFNITLGPAPFDGQLADVVLSVAQNIQSSNPADQLDATLYRNGVALTDTQPTLTAADGAGFRSTAQGHGTPAVPKTGANGAVERGDMITLDLTRTATGTVTVAPQRAYALAVFHPTTPA